MLFVQSIDKKYAWIIAFFFHDRNPTDEHFNDATEQERTCPGKDGLA